MNTKKWEWMAISNYFGFGYVPDSSLTDW